MESKQQRLWEATTPEHVKAYHRVQTLLNVNKKVRFAEAGLAFGYAVDHLAEPETDEFLADCLYGVVDIFMCQRGSTLNAQALGHFETVLTAAEHIIRWDIQTNHNLRYIGTLEKIFDAEKLYYHDTDPNNMGYYGYDQRNPRPNSRGPTQLRTELIRRFHANKGFETLYEMLTRKIPFVEDDDDDDEDEDEDDFVDEGEEADNQNPRQDASPFGLTTIRILVAPFVRAKEHIGDDAHRAAIAAMSQIRCLSEDEIRKENTDDVVDIYDIFASMYGRKSDDFIRFILDLALKCFNSKAFPLRKLGLEMISRMANDVHINSMHHEYNNNNSSPTFTTNQDGPSQPESPAKDSIFHDHAMQDWIVRNKVVQGLFGAAKSTHPVLIDSSKGLLEYLLRTGCLNNGLIDVIFESTIGNHESIQGAVHSLLADLTLDNSAPVDSVCYILNSAVKLVEQGYVDEMMFFAEKVMPSDHGTGHQRRYIHAQPQVLRSMLGLLWSLLFTRTSNPNSAGLDDGKRQLLVSFIVDVLRLKDSVSFRQTCIADCVSKIQESCTLVSVPDVVVGKSPRANGTGSTPLQDPQLAPPPAPSLTMNPSASSSSLTGAKTVRASAMMYDTQLISTYELLKNIIGLYFSMGHARQYMQHGQPMKPMSTQNEIIGNLNDEFDILHLVVKEMDACQTRWTNLSSRAETAPPKSQQENLDTHMHSVQIRLEFLRYILGRSALELSYDHIHDLWGTLHPTKEREVCLTWLRRIAIMDANLQRAVDANSMEQVFVNLLCKTLDFKELSVQGLRCVATFFLDVNRARGVLDGEVIQMEGRYGGAAKSSGDGQVQILRVVNGDIVGMDTIWNIVLYAPVETALEAMKLLLQVQIKLEGSSSTNDPARIATKAASSDSTQQQDAPPTTAETAAHHRQVFLEHVFRCMDNNGQHDDAILHRCMQLLGVYLENYPLPAGTQPHAPVLGNEIELVVHHDQVLVHSPADIGKHLDKRFRQPPNMPTQFKWYTGIIFAYDPVADTHSVRYADGEVKTYNMHSLSRSGTTAVPRSEMHYRMVKQQGPQALGEVDLGITADVDPAIRAAVGSYKPITIVVKEGTPLSAVRALVMERLGTNPSNTPLTLRNMVLRAVDSESADTDAVPNKSALSGMPATSRVLNGPHSDMVSAGHGTLLRGEQHAICTLLAGSGSRHFLQLDCNDGIPNDRGLDAGDLLPASIITQQGSKYFEILMSLLDDSQISNSTRRQLWDLLMALPTGRTQKGRLQSDFKSLDWTKELAANRDVSMLRSVYLLQIVDHFLDGVGVAPAGSAPQQIVAEMDHPLQAEQSDKEKMHTWRDTFLASGGFQQICVLLQQLLEASSKAAQDLSNQLPPGDASTAAVDPIAMDAVLEDRVRFLQWEQKVSLPVLLRIIRFCVTSCLENGDNSHLQVSDELWRSLVESLYLLVTNVQASGVKDKLHSAEKTEDDECTSNGGLGEFSDVGPKPGEVDNIEMMRDVLCNAVDIVSSILATHENLVLAFIMQLKQQQQKQKATGTNATGQQLAISVHVGSQVQHASLLDVLLVNPYPPFRKRLRKLLFEIARSSPEAFAIVEDQALRTLLQIPRQCDTSQDYFLFVAKLLMFKEGTHTFDAAKCARIVSRSIIHYVDPILVDGVVTTPKVDGGIVSSSGNVSRSPAAAVNVSGKSAQSGASPSTSVDQTLIGYLHLMLRLLDHGGSFGDNDDMLVCEPLMQSLLFRYLLALPSSENKKHVAYATDPETRKNCFALLHALARKSERNLLWIVDKLQSFFDATPVPVSRSGKFEWSFKPDHARKASEGFVGLVNQGATCYQNSVLQQLFMAKPVRDIIFDAASSWSILKPLPESGEAPRDGKRRVKPRTKDNLLKTLQRTFSFLKDSERQYFNPRPFVNQSAVLNLSDGHLNQNDAIEFYSRLIDCIEDSLTGQGGKERLQDLLYVKTCTMNVRKCPGMHQTESEMGTPFLTLNVRSGMAGPTLHTLEEALESTFKAEKLSGLQCEACNLDDPEGRYDAEQIKYFSNLPPVLMMQLQRFDFDYDAMQPTKLNHRVSFGMRIDLKKFTKDYVLDKVLSEDSPPQDGEESGGDDEEEENPREQAPKPTMQGDEEESPTLYDLTGVVVHQGSGANFGHYYSFIKDRESGRWFKFDDERVSPFDEKNIEDECFGGAYRSVDSLSSKGSNKFQSTYTKSFSPMSKSNNAYLLLYEQVYPPKSQDPHKKDRGDRVPSDEVAKMMEALTLAKSSDPVSNNKFTRLAWMVTRLQRLKRKAQARVEAVVCAQRHEAEVWEDNQRTLRHAIAFSPDLIDFCLGFVRLVSGPADGSDGRSQEPSSVAPTSWSPNTYQSVSMFGMTVFVKIISRAMSQKNQLHVWVTKLKDLMLRTHGLVDWFITKMTQDNKSRLEWFESLLVHCPDRGARDSFLGMVLEMLRHIDGASDMAPEVKQQYLTGMANAALASMPKGLANCLHAAPLMQLWRELASKDCLRPFLVEKNVPLLLLEFFVDNDPNGRLSLNAQSEQNSQMNRRMMGSPNGMDMTSSSVHLATVNAKANFGPLIHAVTYILAPDVIPTFEQEHRINALPSMEKLVQLQCVSSAKYRAIHQVLLRCIDKVNPATEELLQSDDLAFQLVTREPGASGVLLALLVKGESKKSENVLQELDNIVKQALTATSMAAQNRIVTGAMEAMTCFALVPDSWSNSRAKLLVEKTLRLCLTYRNNVEDAQKRNMHQRRTHNSFAYMEHDQEQTTRSVNVILQVAKMYAALFYQSNHVRDWLVQHVDHWAWMPSWLDKFSYDTNLHGSTDVCTRSVVVGLTVNNIRKIFLAVSGDPVPPLVPVTTSHVRVEGAGIPDINGLYRFDGYFPKGASEQVDSRTPKFVKIANGKKYHLYRCKIQHAHFNWYISNVSAKPGTSSDVDYYCSHQKDKPTQLPPISNWLCCGQGLEPPPTQVRFEKLAMDPAEDLLQYFGGTVADNRQGVSEVTANVPPSPLPPLSSNSGSDDSSVCLSSD